MLLLLAVRIQSVTRLYSNRPLNWERFILFLFKLKSCNSHTQEYIYKLIYTPSMSGRNRIPTKSRNEGNIWRSCIVLESIQEVKYKDALSNDDYEICIPVLSCSYIMEGPEELVQSIHHGGSDCLQRDGSHG